MRISPATFVPTKAQRPPRRAELMLRYVSAYGCMLIALAAAQLVSSNAFILVLTGITLLGLPLSLTLRQLVNSSQRWRSYRFFINSSIVIGSFIFSLVYLGISHPELISPNFMRVLVIDYGVADSIKVLMELFLVFSTMRALAIINDHEAVLSAVPSFSALLLLMVIHRGPQVVFYFALWTVVAAVLFTLDHRAEAAGKVDGRIAAMERGQEVRLSARSLATVLVFSLVIAMGIAYTLSNRNPDERGQLERWVMQIASGISKMALNLPDVSINNGPERQIDFTSSPAVPGRAELWRVGAVSFSRQVIHPQYWRMFTLVNYDGKTWSQASGAGIPVPQTRLDSTQWPFLPRGTSSTSDAMQRPWPRHGLPGYDVNTAFPNGQNPLHDFGANQHYARVVMESRVANIGFVPQIPAVKAVRERSENVSSSGIDSPFGSNILENKTIRIRRDGSIDMGVLQPGHRVQFLSAVPADSQYGMAGTPPLVIGETPNPQAFLPAAERKANLQLPPRLLEPSSRLLAYANDALKGARPEDSDYSRAKRLAATISSNGVYTLSPPTIPAGADAAEYFLCDNPRGYCTYFAGALTVLCRLSGIPARVVSGFVNPEWDSSSGIGILREANAHAWTEVWVPGWGWAPVDATPPGDRGNNAMSPWDSWKSTSYNAFLASRDWLRDHPWALAFPSLLLALALILLIRTYGLPLFLQRWLVSWKRDSYRGTVNQANQTVLRSYQSMAARLARRFRPRTHWETPQEWVGAAVRNLDIENPAPFHELTSLYERSRYASSLVGHSTATHALMLLNSLSWKRAEGESKESRG